MMGRIRHWWVAAGVVVVALGAAATELAVDDGFGSALKAFVAGALAALVAVLALTLPGVDWRGLLLGAFFIGSGVAAWVFMDEPLVIWALIGVQGVFCLIWGWPYLSNLREGVRLGATWLGVAYWVLGVIGALLVFDVGVTAQRVAYAGIAGLAVAAVVGLVRSGADLTVGIVAAFLFALAALLLSGSGNLFETVHTVPPGKWGASFEGRFWGGEYLLYHPNALAGLAVMVAIRVGPDKLFAAWQRLAVTALAGFMVYATNSRTAFVLLVAGGGLHAVMLWWRRRRDIPGLPDYGDTRRTLVAAAVPFLVLALVLIVSGGQGFIFKERYGSGGVTSGRVDTWKFVVDEWKAAPVTDKLFGDTKTARAVVERPGGEGLLLPTDSSAVGSLRRGGVLGVVAFLFGLALLLWHGLAWVIRRGPPAPAWFAMAAIASVPTLALNDWLLGGTGGTFWILLLAGEAYLLARRQAVLPKSRTRAAA
ncbi:hypothetical protein GCM10009557_92110 [Virgisporangium ochraceum]|uniref:O-antigen ligase-related domain-containing protein n=1 Tax=Virgisporangium ochraceum TaxID=65505 RepID=A0A8J3ZLS8_9ACTN|nr:O-antigen ligase family protein [Virgisporangium ochraceum]GIJ66106.1 hypothetical protein Voc01_010230 [Virgisporangium ochraceum]